MKGWMYFVSVNSYTILVMAAFGLVFPVRLRAFSHSFSASSPGGVSQ
jgi:hypothetical protein